MQIASLCLDKKKAAGGVLHFICNTADRVEYIGVAFKMLCPLVTANYGVQRLHIYAVTSKILCPPSTTNYVWRSNFYKKILDKSGQ